jgi:SAM-dependent methyltransferase
LREPVAGAEDALTDGSARGAGRGTDAMWGRDTEWAMVLPPNRPPLYVLDVVARCVREHAGVKTLAVLGSTPEFLDEAHAQDVPEIVCLDRSLDFHKSSLALRRLPAREHLVLGDWLRTLPDHRQAFDVVLSDLTLGNLTYAHQQDFLRLVAHSLRPGGVFIDRILTYRRSCYSYDELFQRFRRQPANLQTLNDFNAQWLFCGERVESLEVVDPAATYNWSDAEFGATEIGWFIRNCERVTPRGPVWHYGRPWSDVGIIYNDIFSLQQEVAEPPSSAFAGFVSVRVSSAVGPVRRKRSLGDRQYQ